MAHHSYLGVKMNKISGALKGSADNVAIGIKRKTYKHYTVREKIRYYETCSE